MTCKHEHRKIEAMPRQLGGGAVVVCMDCDEYWELDEEPLPTLWKDAIDPDPPVDDTWENHHPRRSTTHN